MSNVSSQNQRVLSGMRPTGKIHLGHYYGVLQNWLELQQEFECFFFAADWHALTTHYENSQNIYEDSHEMVLTWLASGVNPSSSTIFLQSQVPEHAELHVLLSMITPLSWLERVPSYRDQQEKLRDMDLDTYGFLGYPLLQSADILMYRAGQVPVGEDQVAHVELTREIARRFNHIYGKDEGFEEKAEKAIAKMGKKQAAMYKSLRQAYQQDGQHDALKKARALLDSQKNISLNDQERLFGYLEGGGKVILPEPESLLTKDAKVPGIDGQKMSKSYGNTIALLDSQETVEKKIKTMPTDPARVRLSDPGDPGKCPVWEWHQQYSSEDVKTWVMSGCKNAEIGCIQCKGPVIDAIEKTLSPIRENADEYRKDKDLVKDILDEGAQKARAVASETLSEVKRAIGLTR